MVIWLWSILLVLSQVHAQDSEPFGGLRFRAIPGVPGAQLKINDAGDLLVSKPGRIIRADGSEIDLGLHSDATAVAINNRGQVLVQQGDKMFLRQADGTLESRDYPGAFEVRGHALNDAGQIAGFARVFAGGHMVLWDETGTPSALPSLFSLNSHQLMAINGAGELAGGYSKGSGPYGVFRRTPDGFFREVGTAVRFPSIGLSDSGLLFFTHSYALGSVNTEIRANDGAVLYAARDTYIRPSGSTPLISSMSPNGRLFVGRLFPWGPDFVAEGCATEVTPRKADLPLEGGTIVLAVAAAQDCEWYYSGSRRRGDAEISLRIEPSQVPKLVHATVAGKDVVIRQGEGGCEYSLPGSAFLVPPAGGTVSVSIRTEPDCAWTAIAPSDSTVNPPSGFGPGEILLTIGPVQPSPLPYRSREFTIAGQRFIVVQRSRPEGL